MVLPTRLAALSGAKRTAAAILLRPFTRRHYSITSSTKTELSPVHWRFHRDWASTEGNWTISKLVEDLDAVNGRIPVLIDGGVSRGTDVLKALGLRIGARLKINQITQDNVTRA
jgi:hypothetical protein